MNHHAMMYICGSVGKDFMRVAMNSSTDLSELFLIFRITYDSC